MSLGFRPEERYACPHHCEVRCAMSGLSHTKDGVTVKAYAGDSKTLLAFNFADPKSAKNLAGFTIHCQPPGEKPYYLWNTLQFPDPSRHAQLPGEPPHSSANAPFQKYRWVHVT